jgi:hypothetical protein
MWTTQLRKEAKSKTSASLDDSNQIGGLRVAMGKDDEKLMPLPMPNIAVKEIDARDKGCARAQPQPAQRTPAHRRVCLVRSQYT